jgi:hypothetical protein
MISDNSQPAEGGVIFVKSTDGSPPDPTFEMIMSYTFGHDPTEYQVRIHGEDSPATIREGLKKLDPGKNPAELMFEDAEMNDDDPVGDWISRTGTSQFKGNWRMAREYQKFWLWTPTGEEDLGDEEWDGCSAEEMCQSLRRKNCGLAELKDCHL